MALSLVVPDAYSFMSVSQEIVTLEGESVTIQCEVANLGELVSVHVFTCSCLHSVFVGKFSFDHPAAMCLLPITQTCQKDPMVTKTPYRFPCIM